MRRGGEAPQARRAQNRRERKGKERKEKKRKGREGRAILQLASSTRRLSPTGGAPAPAADSSPMPEDALLLSAPGPSPSGLFCAPFRGGQKKRKKGGGQREKEREQDGREDRSPSCAGGELKRGGTCIGRSDGDGLLPEEAR